MKASEWVGVKGAEFRVFLLHLHCLLPGSGDADVADPRETHDLACDRYPRHRFHEFGRLRGILPDAIAL